MIFHCAVCQTEFVPGLDRCPACGAADAMVGAFAPDGVRVSAARPDPASLTVGDTVFRLYGRGDPAYKQGARFLRHNIKVEYSKDRGQLEYVERVFDKIRRTYVERCFDPKTGAVTFEKEGPIRDQTVHSRRSRGAE